MNRTVDAIHSISPSQRGMLFDALGASTGIHVEQSVIAMDGRDRETFAEAWRCLVRTHEALRSAFLWNGVDEPLQVVFADAEAEIADSDEPLDVYLTRDRARGFDMSRAPLMRVAFVDGHCVWTHHHILLDGWCVPILARDLFAAYDGLPLVAPRPYRDYIDWLKKQDIAAAETFWRRELAGITKPTLGLRARGPFSETRIELGEEPRALARRHRVPLNIVLQAMWARLLADYSGEERVVFGTTISGRPEELRGVESMIGLFINTVPVVATVEDDLERWLPRLHEAQLERERFGWCAAGQIHEWSGVPLSKPLFDSLLVVENFPHSALGSARSIGARTRYPLNLIIETAPSLSLTLVHRGIENAEAIAEDFLGVRRLRRRFSILKRRPSRRTPKLFRDLLGDDVEPTDNLFDLGGHSLLAARIAARLGVPLHVVFENPTIEQLARLAGTHEPIPRAEKRDQLSFAQERLWFLHQLDPDSPAYRVRGAVRFIGDLDRERLHAAIANIVQRHEVLRTSYLPNENFRYELSDDQVLTVEMHHIVTDGWSNSIFFRELAAFYEGRELPPLALQYADYAAWQRAALTGERLESLLAYWTEKLAGAPPLLPLPTDRPRAATQRYRGDMVAAEIDAAALRELAKDERATLFMVLLAGFVVALKRWSGEEDVVVGTPIANRDRQGLEDLIGFFVNTLALRTSAAGNPSFRELVRRVRATALEAYAHQELPFERLVEALQPQRDLSFNPLFQVFFNMLNVPPIAEAVGDLRVEPVPLPETVTRFDLTLYAIEDEDRVRFELVYDADLFDRTTAERMLAQLCTFLGNAASMPDASMHALPMEPARPRIEIAEEPQPPMHAAFLEQVRRVPGAVAVVDEEGAWTYAELDAKSDAAAAELSRHHPAGVVPVPASASASLVVSILGALKLGRPFRSAAATPPLSYQGNAAYLVQTSGTTGTPLTIAGTHAPVTHFLQWHIATHGLTERDRFSLLSGVAHDPLLRDIFTPLSIGASLFIPPKDVRVSSDLPRWMAEHGITVAHLTPALGELLDSEVPSLRWLFFGGDRLTYADVARIRRIAPNARIVNFYGTTETPQAMSFYAVDDEDDPRITVPVGRGIDDVELLLLNEANAIAATGELAEICVKTPYLSLGYLEPDAPPRFGSGMYRTGDLGRYRADGNVTIAGRRDRQIKVRGFRIEPREIEAVLERHPGVREAAVIADNDTLLAFVVGAHVERAWLVEQLPEHLVPSRITQIDAIPLTPNGKLDVASLRAHEALSSRAKSRDPLPTQLEASIAKIWSEILEKEVGVTDDFFALGGHSLKATRVISRIERDLGMRIPLRELFLHPTVRELARASRGAARFIAHLPDADTYAVSHAQRRLWLLGQTSGAAYHMARTLLVEGEFDAARFEDALRAVSMRHESLRTTFEMIDGELRQRVHPSPLIAFDEDIDQPFDLERGPLVRVRIEKTACDRHLLHFNIHHIVADAWSLDVLVREIEDAGSLPPLRLQYRDYAAWQNALGIDDAYWRGKLAAPLPRIDLPTDRPRPAVRSYRGARAAFAIDARALESFARARGASLYMLLVASVNVLLHRYTGAEDILVGGAVAGRTHAELEGQIGLYASLLALRTPLEPGLPFAEFLARVRQTAEEAYEHQDVPFGSPHFDVVVVLQNGRSAELRIQGARVTQLERPAETSKFDLNFTFEENGDAFLEYDTDLFDADRAQRITSHFTTLLASILHDPSAAVADLEILPGDERRLVVETFNDTDASYPDATIDALFRERAAQQPDAVAVICEDRTLTYGELARRASTYADELRARGIGGFVGVRAERSEETIIRFLGILEAGAAYVPVDPSYPEERIEFIFEDAERAASVPGAAYVIYTSGSTGKPKGCVVTHRNVVRLLVNDRFPFDFDERDTWLLAHSFAFDFSVWEMYGALLYGGTLVIAQRDDARNPEALRALIREHNVTVLNQTPASFYALADVESRAPVHDLSLRTVIFGGDKLDPARLRGFANLYPATQLVNMYGITETTVHVTYGPLHDLDAVSPIGVPLPETRVYVLDARMHPQPIGVPGEIWVGGSGVCAGYLHRPELTAERFVDTQYGRLYRSGDVARWNADGTLRYHGRNDHQIQLRGFRIELGEIEHVLGGAIVRVIDDRLVAWVRGDVEALRARAKAQLPAHMVPSRFISIDEIPLTSNGKVDYAALPAGNDVIAQRWREVLGRDDIGPDDNFFDLGGHSFLLVQLHRQLHEDGIDIPLVDLFRYPTLRALQFRSAVASPPLWDQSGGEAAALLNIAIIGLAGRFPGAPNIEAFWHNLKHGIESSVTLTDEELKKSGVPQHHLDNPRYVRTKPILDGIDLFDADFFGIPPREAEVTDPQHRVFLESALEALENAGYGDVAGERVGVFAGASLNSYLLNNLVSNRDLLETLGVYPVLIGNDRDFVASRVAYKLDLRGPAINVSTACSTSLVAVHLACRSLRDGECDLALAGAASIKVPQAEGYLYDEGGILSPDGRCRAFDAKANGTVGGSGAGIVVLKRLADAMRDGDRIVAVIRGTAIGNDGADKVGYTAPGVHGQAAVIARAHAAAGVDAQSIQYVETHGTGTSLGDPIEIAALTEAFKGAQRCAIGSVKTNIGHLDAAAGVAGLIKAALALQHEQIPPSLNFDTPNPNIDFANGPFFVNTELRAWPRGEATRRAGVSSFGLGGNNVHVVLEEAPIHQTASDTRPLQLLPLSARTPTSLAAQTRNIVEHLDNVNVADAAYTLAVGRRAHEHRAFLVSDTLRPVTGKRKRDPHVVFLFPGGGAQYAEMGAELYRHERVYREAIDRCGVSITASEKPSEALPALFAVEYALAQLWRSWGIEPHAMIGHSLGEYAAACIAGVFSLDDALALVRLRSRLFETIEEGAMLSVPLPEHELVLPDGLSIAAINHPNACVVSGRIDRVHELEATLAQRDVDTRLLHIAVAAHSPLVDPILEEFRAFVASLQLHAPQRKIVSNLTGAVLTTDEARDPGYWTRHLRETVRFAGGAAALLRDPDAVFLECGPGNTLASLVQRHPARGEQTVIHSMRHPQDPQSDYAVLLHAAGRLWIEGAPLDWKRFYEGQRRTRVALPGTVFERKRYWIEPNARPSRKANVADWFYAPTWKRMKRAELAHLEGRVLLDPDLQTLLAAASESRDEEITVVTTNAHDVTGDEPLDPERAMVLGAIKVINQESPRPRIRTIDGDAKRLECGDASRRSSSEPSQSGSSRCRTPDLTVRGAYCWQQTYEPVRLDGTRLKKNATYVITGGTGTVGRILERYLRETWNARVITIARGDDADLRADVANEVELRSALDSIGSIDGVIHAAGVTKGSSIFVPFEELRAEDVEAQLRPKMQGTRALARALEGRPLDFVLLISSNASVLGGLGLAAYAAANQFLDSFAALMNREGATPWISANFDGWPSAETHGEFAMSLDEAHEVFRRVTSARGQIIVSAGDLDARLERFVELAPEPIANAVIADDATDVQRRLRELWREMLGVSDVALDDNFFQLRGDSLLGTRMVTRANAMFGVDLPLRSLFEEPTVAGLAERIERARNRGVRAIPRIPDAPSYALSHAQQRLWLLSQIEGASVAYNIPLSLQLDGDLDVDALRGALRRLVARHESLRTSFVQTEHGPVQRVEHDAAFELSYRACSEAAAFRQGHALAMLPFDLTRAPLLRGELLKIGEERHVLHLVVHHIVCDGWSLGVMARELGELYAGRSLAPLRIHYRDFAAWQRAIAPPEDFELPRPLDLPSDVPRPAVPRFRGDLLTFTVEQREALLALANGEQATLFMLLAALVKVLLHRYSGAEDVAVGSPVAGRRHEDLHDQIGLYLNTLVLRDRVSPPMTFLELLHAVRQTCLDAYEHQDVPFDLLAERAPRDLSRAPVVDVMVILQIAGGIPLRLGDVRVTPLPVDSATSKVDLTFDFADEGGALQAGIRYSTDLFTRDRIERMARHFTTLIDSVLRDPSQSIGAIDFLPHDERRFLVETVNDTAMPIENGTNVVSLFEAQADRTPNAVAVSSLTYGALDAWANFVAQTLPSNVLIGVSIERGVELLVALLAILKAGSAYVPLDTHAPPHRNGLVLADAEPALVLRDIPRGAATRAPRAIDDESLAYVLYTSGSTGTPKGVEIPHRALANVLLAFRPLIDAGDTLLAVTTISFDIAGLELFLPLIAGARVEIARDTGDAHALARQLRQATIMQATPAAWRMLLAAGWEGDPRLRILCGGEALPPDLADALRARSKELWNVYGPTETTIWSTMHRVEDEPLIGRPIANTRVYVLDANLQLAPVGVAGELCIGGRGVARGYRKRAALTGERFIADPFVEGERLYRTGDVARIRADGAIEIHGRKDHQLKVRGYRVEAGDVEAAILAHEGVAETVVVLRGDALVAYVAGGVDPAELRAHLAARLPSYMIPSAFVAVDALPRNTSGKVDRAALPDPERDVRAGEEPRDELERDLARIWADELGRVRLGIHDHFFENGGHSLKATRALFRLQRELGVDAALIDLFRNPTVAAFAAAVRGRVPAVFEEPR